MKLLSFNTNEEILIDDEDYEKFLAILDTYRKKIGYEIYGYCLMGNHVHR